MFPPLKTESKHLEGLNTWKGEPAGPAEAFLDFSGLFALFYFYSATRCCSGRVCFELESVELDSVLASRCSSGGSHRAPQSVNQILAPMFKSFRTSESTHLIQSKGRHVSEPDNCFAKHVQWTLSTQITVRDCLLKGGYRKIFLFFHKSRWA